MTRFEIVESTGHGKNVAGNKRTSTVQVQAHPDNVDYYLLKKQFRFTVGDAASCQKAWQKARAYVLAESAKIENLTPTI